MNSPQYWHVLNPVLIKIPASIFVDIEKLILKFIWKSKGTRVVNTILKKKECGRTHHVQF